MPEVIDTVQPKTNVITLALLGAPNCGKSSMFNALTGGRAKVANYPGVTVEYRKGTFETPRGQGVKLWDLPGIYGDCGHSMDERVTIGAIKGELAGETRPDGLIVMMDASHITTHLHNVLQAKNYGLPMILVLNMMDMAARDGIEIDIAALSEEIGVPVIPSVAVRSSGRAHLSEYLDGWIDTIRAGAVPVPSVRETGLKALQAQAREITAKAVTTAQKSETFTDKVDKIVLHPVLGPIILFAILFAMFQAVYTGRGRLLI